MAGKNGGREQEKTVVESRKKTPLKAAKAKAWKLFSEYIRRKYSLGGVAACFTCGLKASWRDLQCGHAIPGRTNAVLLDCDICRPQCYQCNVRKYGMLHVFVIKLIAERGGDGMNWWQSKMQEAKANKKMTATDYIDQCEIFKSMLDNMRNKL